MSPEADLNLERDLQGVKNKNIYQDSGADSSTWEDSFKSDLIIVEILLIFFFFLGGDNKTNICTSWV